MAAPALDSQRSRAWLRFKKNPGALLGAALVALAVLSAVAAPLLAPHDPDLPYKARAIVGGLPIGPDAQFPLGADSLGRCELSRLLFGGRVSLAVAFSATALLSFVGTFVGVLAGYAGKWVDTALMRFVDLLLSFPFLLVVMAVNRAVSRPGIWVLFLMLGLLSWTGLSRQVRAKTMQLERLEFIVAAQALGLSPLQIVLRHIVPNVLPLVVVLATSLVAEMVIAESVLSYLGVGVVPPTSSWGSMLQESDPLLRTVPRLALLPGGAIFLTVVGFNLLGEGLRDALDPKG